MNEEQKYELELPTIRDIELQIWKIGRYGKNPEAQLEACRFLLERIEAREKAERGVVGDYGVSKPERSQGHGRVKKAIPPRYGFRTFVAHRADLVPSGHIYMP